MLALAAVGVVSTLLSSRTQLLSALYRAASVVNSRSTSRLTMHLMHALRHPRIYRVEKPERAVAGAVLLRCEQQSYR